MSREVVVVSAVRTAIGTFGGSLKDIAPTALAAQVVVTALDPGGSGEDDVVELGPVLVGDDEHPFTRNRRRRLCIRLSDLRQSIRTRQRRLGPNHHRWHHRLCLVYVLGRSHGI